MKKIDVFFRPEQSCSSNESYSPSAGKPRLVMQDWLATSEIAERIQVQTFEPLTEPEIAVAHDPQYVKAVLACVEENGFNNRNPEVAQSLRFTTGSFYAAAKHVVATFDAGVAFSLTSGFHHAGYSYGGGFCTFNGLIIAAKLLKQHGLIQRVAILDYDQHYGDGTQQIIDRLNLKWITHVSSDKSYTTTEQCVKSFAPEALAKVIQGCNLVMFQAGADIHHLDPLGGLLTTEQMRARDQSVIEACAALNIPLVINLAGGYQRDKRGSIEPVLALHRQTIEEAIHAQRNHV